MSMSTTPEMILTLMVSAARTHGDGWMFEMKQLDYPEDQITAQLENLRGRGLIAWKRGERLVQVTKEGREYEATAEAQAIVAGA